MNLRTLLTACAAGSLLTFLAGLPVSSAQPLWAGARFTRQDKARAIERGVRAVYRLARQPQAFAEHGEDLLWWFGALATRTQDPALRQTARGMGVECARRWRRTHRRLPRRPDADTVAEFAAGDDDANAVQVRDDQLKAQIRRAAPRFTAREYLAFDPRREPPPGDVPEECAYCDATNPRGSRVCRVCKRPLAMKSRYDVWYDALITTYVGERYGVPLGARYADVLRWLPALRPYRGRQGGANPDFVDSVYAVTHLVYTLNDYWAYKLPPELLPQEIAFLRASVPEAAALGDVDMMGEILDALKSFGVAEDDPLIRRGTEFLLARQNPDGSWGDVKETDIYNRYHTTETAVNGLSDYTLPKEGPWLPGIKDMIERFPR